MMAGYFDQLGDVVPEETLRAMEMACQRATHEDAGRSGEPAVLAGVRALLERFVSREQHAEEIGRLVRIQRSDFTASQEHLARRVEEVRADARDGIRRLERVRSLVDHRRKTLPMESLVRALDTPID